MRWSKGLDMKWSLYMSSNQQNLTIGSIRLKSDNRVAKISLTTGLGSDPAHNMQATSLDVSLAQSHPPRGQNPKPRAQLLRRAQ